MKKAMLAPAALLAAPAAAQDPRVVQTRIATPGQLDASLVRPDPAKATGTAAIVAPGGALMSPSMDAEGRDVARWLADHRIAALMLDSNGFPQARK